MGKMDGGVAGDTGRSWVTQGQGKGLHFTLHFTWKFHSIFSLARERYILIYSEMGLLGLLDWMYKVKGKRKSG